MTDAECIADLERQLAHIQQSTGACAEIQMRQEINRYREVLEYLRPQAEQIFNKGGADRMRAHHMMTAIDEALAAALPGC